jgi:TolB protein
VDIGGLHTFEGRALGAVDRSSLAPLSRRAILLGGAACVATGLWHTRAGASGQIAFIDESGPRERRVKRVAVMDLAGGSVRFLTDGRDTVLTPRFSPSGREIVYVSVGPAGSSRVHLVQVASGRREIVGDQAFAPRFSPDDHTLVVSIARPDHNVNLFAIDLAVKTITRLTDGAAIDTAACYSPDGRYICFESDRDGRPQIYRMSAGGGAAQRISFGAGDHTAPVWSPRGDLIAFTRQWEGRCTVGIMHVDGSREVVLAEASPDVSPAFAPDGQSVMFFRDGGAASGPSLFTIDLGGRDEARVPTPGYAYDPDWAVS